MSAGIDIAVLLLEIWPASVTVFFQDMSAADPAAKCGMTWVGCLLSWEKGRGQGPSTLVPSTA